MEFNSEILQSGKTVIPKIKLLKFGLYVCKPYLSYSTIFPTLLRDRRRLMKDPICGMMVDEKKTKLVSEHDGQKFYFCSASCKQKFDTDPHGYAH
jgi:YHS domain-containing protein